MSNGISARMKSVWGDVFEVAVKRGALSYLVEHGSIEASHASISQWSETRVRRIREHCLEQAEAVADQTVSEIRSYCDHLIYIGYGIGWTTMRKYFQSLPGRQTYKISSLWCPLDLKDRRNPAAAFDPHVESDFGIAFDLKGVPGLAGRGWPARADFLMMIETSRVTRILCLEFSLNVPPSQADYADPQPHRREVSRYASLVSSRGVFSHISAEVNDLDGGFDVSPDIVKHMQAFTSRDKPLYKLMQGCSYGSTVAGLVLSDRSLEVDVIAVTGAGIERVSAPFGPGSEGSVKRKAMETMGAVYRESKNFATDADFADHLDKVYLQVRRGMPRAFRKAFDAFLSDTREGKIQTAGIIEEMTGFLNPATSIPEQTVDEWLAATPGDERMKSFLGDDPAAAIRTELSGKKTLRDLNAAAIRAALRATKPGEFKVVGLLGHPGIGKTTSVINLFKSMDDEKVLFGYFSPRVVINGDVTTKITESCGPGSFAVTSNSHLIKVAGEWAKMNGIMREVTGAVAVDGPQSVIRRPYADGGILQLDKTDARDAAEGNYVSRTSKIDIDIRTLEIECPRAPGVLRTLASETGHLLRANPGSPVVALTAAIQGFRMSSGSKTTVDELQSMFRHKADTAAGKDERLKFAQSRPVIVVMVDEITGDAAGAPMCHAISDWLRREFIDPFDGRSPFRVTLFLADASLATPETFASFMTSAQKSLAAGASYDDAPARVMISPADRTTPFAVSTGTVDLDGSREEIMYVMADGYPAGRLDIAYNVRLDQVDMKDAKDEEGRRREREAHSERMMQAAVSAIRQAAAKDPEKQVIYFAQDKRFLDAVRNSLVAAGMDENRVATLHSSVNAERRRELVSEHVRDQMDVFLMTSAGSRGVSFPKATTIIIQVPRFEIESSLMEIGQMIFRGRGGFEQDGRRVDGDVFDRRIVFMIEDYVRTDDAGALHATDWAARKVELASLLVLLRATVETRIKGRSDSPGFRGAVIPVGRVGLDLTSDTLSAALMLLIAECNVTKETKDKNTQGIVRTIESTINELFGNFSITGKAPGMKSFTSAAFAEEFSTKVGSSSSALLKPRGDNVAIPESAHFCGACVYESWKDVKDIVESFHHGVDSHDKRKKLALLCRTLSDDMSVPKRLRDAAHAVADMTSRTTAELDGMEYSVRKKTKTKDVWIVMPADWTRFVSDREGSRDRRLKKVDAADLWLPTMRQAMSLHRTPTALMPIVPNFDDMPFAASLTHGDPTGMDVAFDPRYFFSSTEFNLLNAILYSCETD